MLLMQRMNPHLIIDFSQENVAEFVNILIDIIKSNETCDADKINAIKIILGYAFGNPAEIPYEYYLDDEEDDKG